MDVGTGDGRFVLEEARRDTRALVIGIDANVASMVGASRRAAAKAARGGRPNALFLVTAAETLPTELSGIAGGVTVNFPWGSLLRGVLAQDLPILAGLGRLLGPNGSFQAMVSAVARDGLALPDESELWAGYRAAGLDLSEYRQAAAQEIAERPTSWARRLGAGRDRPVWRIVAGSTTA